MSFVIKREILKEEIHKGAFYVTYDSGNEIYKLDKAHQYYFQVQLPELFTRKHENENINDTGKIENIPLNTATNDCIPNCKVSKACEMVGCHSCDNWYHLSCMKLKNVSKTKTWYCTS